MTTARVVVLIFCLLYACTTSGKQDNYFCTVKYKDSITIDRHSRILYNNVFITNTYRQPITVLISVNGPQGWRLLSDGEITLSLAPGEKQILPLAFMKMTNAIATWAPVDINIQLQNTSDNAQYRFFIKANSLSRFRMVSKVDNIEMLTRDQKIIIPLKITNSGSIPGIYTLTWKCPGLDIDEKVSILLEAQKDTEYIYSRKIPAGVWPTLKNEKLELVISDTAGNTYNHIFNVYKVGSELKMHASRFQTFPLTLQGGILNSGRDFTYYGGLHGEITFDKDNRLNFSYRSKQLGISTEFQRNIWMVEYFHQRWSYYVGTTQGSRFFAINGTGAKVRYKWKEHGEISLSGSLHDQQYYYAGYYANDNLTADLKYALKRIVFWHTATSNFDLTYHLNSYIFWNNVQLLKNKTTILEVTGAIGLDHSTNQIANAPKELWGSSLGYLFNYHKNKWSIASNLEENSNNYPGLRKGLRFQSHNINRQFGKVPLGLFYESNYTQSNYFRDTIYRSDVFTYNITKYGIRSGWYGKNMGFGLSLGIMSQEGIGNSIGPKYPYTDFNYSYSKRKFHLLFRSLTGYTNKNGNVREDVFVTSSNIHIYNTHFGVQGFYERTPIVNPMELKPITGFIETLNFITYMNFKIRKTFGGQLRYSISKSLYDNSVQSYIGGNLNYHNEKKGLAIDFFGNIPLQKTNDMIPGFNRQYLSLTVSKRFNFPVFVKRKYYDLKVVAFFDENNNGIRDNNEKLLSNVAIELNGLLFLTDEQGSFSYENIERGIYTVDLHNVKNIKGIIPSSGFIQKINVTENTTYEIPFKKSKLISGSIKVILDSLSPANFTPDYLKLTATDTAGTVYMTATDELGDYYFNLPSGIYSLSLNARAFTNFIKPLKISYKIDLVNNNEAIVVFEIDQKNRQIKMKTFKID